MNNVIASRVMPFDIDGDIVKPQWSNLLALRENIRGNEPIRPTLFNVLNDGYHLYFAFKVNDEDVNPIRFNYNSKLYEEEVVEIFISAIHKNKYLELEVSPNNTKLCGIIHNNNSKRRRLKLLKQCIFISEVKAQEYGYSVEIKINIKAICNKLNVRDLSDCYFNAYRIDRPQGQAWELSALSPTLREGFHYPDSFVRLVIEE